MPLCGFFFGLVFDLLSLFVVVDSGLVAMSESVSFRTRELAREIVWVLKRREGEELCVL